MTSGTLHTGNFATVALSRSAVEIPSSARRFEGSQIMLTAIPHPLPFILEFRSGERLEIELVGSGREPTSLWRFLHSIKELAELPTGWDSYRAKPIAATAVRRAFPLLPAILPEMAPLPTVVPTANGGLQVEWHRNGIDMEITVPPVGPLTCFIADSNAGTEREWSGTLDMTAIVAALGRIGAAA